MPTTGRFIFDGQEYDIDRAEILGAIPDPYWCDTYNKGRGKTFGWGIRFETKAQDLNGERHAPHVHFNLSIEGISDWRALQGVSVSWSNSIDEHTGERHGLTYVFDHQLISKGTLRITDREGAQFQVIAFGENEEGQTFSIDAPAIFVGIHVHGSGRDSDETVRARLTRHISLANLKATPLAFRDKYESGIKMGSALFKPIE